MTTAYALSLTDGKLTTVELDDGAAALYRDLFTDTLYVAALNNIAGFAAADDGRLTATWKKLITLPKYETFAWYRIESPFTDLDGSAASAILNIYTAAGVLLCTTTVTSTTPDRLQPFKERELILEVISAARITAVTLASTSEELQAIP